MNVEIKIADINSREELKKELYEMIARIDQSELPIAHSVSLYKAGKYNLALNAEPIKVKEL